MFIFDRDKRNGSSKSRSLCGSCYVRYHRQKLKERAISYAGGKCIVCGYDKSRRALSFHHLDPDQKEHTIAEQSTQSWGKMKEEIDKCILVCSNCHAEIHEGLIEAPVVQLVGHAPD